MTRKQLKRALISILIGASVAFITELFRGLLGLFNGWEPDVSGSAAAIVYYLKSRRTV